MQKTSVNADGLVVMTTPYENERIVEARLKWTPAGRVSILCPFHDEETPSCCLEVGVAGSVTRGYWHCFGCELHGGWELLGVSRGHDLLMIVHFDSMVEELHRQGLRFEEIRKRVVEYWDLKYERHKH